MASKGLIILSRMDSRRLPGKALREVGGRPLLDFVLARCRQVSTPDADIVIATSDRAVDDPLERFARANGAAIFRGNVDDVAGRVLACARSCGFAYFARINGDSPFLDAASLDRAFELAEAEGLDLVTNLQPRSFPYGVSVEVVRTESFERAYAEMHRPEHREHVTKYLYENLDRFRYANLQCPLGDQSSVRLTVDTPEDLDWFCGLVERRGPSIDRMSFMDALDFSSQGAMVS